MPNVCIVTDSTAQFWERGYAQKHNVVVAPLTIHFGRQSFRDGIDITTQDFFRRMSAGGPAPVAASPSADQFIAVFEELGKSTHQIVAILVSGKLSRTVRNAQAAADALLGRCKITVIDSLTTSIGLGILVQAAAEAAERGESAEEIIRIARGIIPRLYTMFFVEDLTYLERAERLGRSQAILGAMLGIKPILAIEDGDIVAMEKVRTRVQAIEKLLEFTSEFSCIAQMAILQTMPNHTDRTRMLLERLAVEHPGREVPVLTYGPALATHIGPNSIGITVHEGVENGE